jgi:hypothetical protein
MAKWDKYGTPTEGFFYPSTLSFRAVVVCAQDVENVLFLGIPYSCLSFYRSYPKQDHKF